MAVAIDGSSPAVFTTSSQATVTSASFTPPAGSLVVVAFSGNTNGLANPAAPTITDSLATDLTYTRQVWRSHADGSPAVAGHCAIWTAPVVTSAAMTITVTTSGTNTTEKACRVWVITGQHATTPIGATGGAGSASTSAISQNYTSGGTGGQAFGAVIDWDALGSMTAGSGCTLDGTGDVGTGQISYAFPRRTTADGVNGVTNTLACNPNGTSTNIQWAWVEILPAGGPISRSVSETLTAADAVTRTAALPRAVAETLTAADAVTRTAALPRAVADTLDLAEAVTRTAALPRAVAEALDLAEAVTRTIATAQGSAETLDLADAVTRTVASPSAVADTIDLADSLAHGLVLVRAPADGLAASDTAVGAVTAARAVAETLSIADAVTGVTEASRAVAETLAAADSVAFIAGQARDLGETLAAADAADRTLALASSGDDAVQAGDVAGQGVTLQRGVSDAAVLADQAINGSGVSADVADSLTMDDAAGRAPVSTSRPVADSLQLAQNTARLTVAARSLAQGLVLADSAGRGVLFLRAVPETVTAQDIPHRQVPVAVGVTDALTMADAASGYAFVPPPVAWPHAVAMTSTPASVTVTSQPATITATVMPGGVRRSV